MTTMKGVLRPEEDEVVEKLYSLISDGLREMEEIWGEHPYLRRGPILFKQNHNKFIPVVEIYCVLGGQYRNGNFYEASLLAEHPGWYAYDHKLIPYRLTPSSWRKPAERHLVDLLRKLITKESDMIPAFISKLYVKEGPRSLHMLCQFVGHRSPKLELVFTPALEGSGWPARFAGSAYVAPGNQTTKQSSPICLMVQPFSTTDVVQGWELVFPNIAECILKPEDAHTLHAALLLTWLAEVRGWSKMGLRNPSAAFHVIVFNLALRDDTFSVGCIRDQLKAILKEFGKSITVGSLYDLCVPAVNYLEGITKEQQEDLKQEVEGAMVEIEHPRGLTELCREYPLQISEALPQDAESYSSSEDWESAGSVGSNTLLMQEVEEMDEGGGGEGCYKVCMPPPLAVKELPALEGVNRDQELDEDCDLRCTSIGLLADQEEWSGHQSGRLMCNLLEVILIAVFLVVALREIWAVIECVRGGYCNEPFLCDGEEEDRLTNPYDAPLA